MTTQFYNYSQLKKNTNDNLLKLFKDAMADKEIHIKKLREMSSHYKKHIKQSDEIIENCCKIFSERLK